MSEDTTIAVRTCWGVAVPVVWYQITESWNATRPWVIASPRPQAHGSRTTKATRVRAIIAGNRRAGSRELRHPSPSPRKAATSTPFCR